MADAAGPSSSAPADPPGGGPSWARRAVIGFGRFWWDFLIGDTPELFLGAVVVVGLVAAVCLDHGLRDVAAALLPLLVAGLLTGSVWRASRRRPT
jgi:hypothetical protein